MSTIEIKTDWTPEEIKAFRLNLGMSQCEFAIAIGINRQQSVSEHERGVKPNTACRVLLGQLYEKRGRPALGA